MNWETQIIVLAGVQGILLSIILFKHAFKKNNANKYLALLISIFSVNILIDEACRNLSHQYPHFYGSTYGLQFLFGPILFLYVASLLGWQKSISKKDLLHFMPYLVINILLFPFYIQSGYEKSQLVSELVKGPIIYLLLIKSIPAFHFFGYALFIISRSVHSKQQMYLKSPAFAKLKNRILVVVGVNGIIWLSVGLLYLVRAFFPDLPIKGFIYNITGATTTIFIYIIGYLGWLYPETYHHIAFAFKEEDKYNKSGLAKKDSVQLYEKLKELMKLHKPYLDSDLTLSELAKNMSVSTNHLSQVINENCRVSYFDFINKYRVTLAKQMLEDSANKKNALQIAYAVGFNSKSAYYNAFKKNFNCTPAAIKKNSATIPVNKFAVQP